MLEFWQRPCSTSPKLLNSTKTTPQKKCFFRSISYQIEVMITSLIEMQELLNVGDVIDKNHDLITFFKNIFILRRPRVAIFVDNIKLLTMFIKTIFKDSKKFKRIINYVSKCNLYLYSLIQQNLSISGEKMLMSADLKGCLS